MLVWQGSTSWPESQQRQCTVDSQVNGQEMGGGFPTYLAQQVDHLHLRVQLASLTPAHPRLLRRPAAAVPAAARAAGRAAAHELPYQRGVCLGWVQLVQGQHTVHLPPQPAAQLWWWWWPHGGVAAAGRGGVSSAGGSGSRGGCAGRSGIRGRQEGRGSSGELA